MAECEICGRDAPLYTVEIDRARLSVCFECSKNGKVIGSPPPVQARTKKSPDLPRPRRDETELDLVADYGSRIKEARDKMRISRSVLAEMINEKESFLDRVESERTLPTETLAKKLEKALGISLYEEVGVASQPFSRAEKRGITLGDVIKIKRKGGRDGD
jgi:putative transcription factor